jgi:hypothetical protein
MLDMALFLRFIVGTTLVSHQNVLQHILQALSSSQHSFFNGESMLRWIHSALTSRILFYDQVQIK